MDFFRNKTGCSKVITCENFKSETYFAQDHFWIFHVALPLILSSCYSLDKVSSVFYLTLLRSSVPSPPFESRHATAARIIPTGSGS